MAVPPIIVLALTMCGTPIVLALVALVAREISVRRVRSRGLSNEELSRRLERIEHAVDATAMEVERLAESSGFLIEERRPDLLRSEVRGVELGPSGF